MLATNISSSEEKLRFAFKMYDQDSSGGRWSWKYFILHILIQEVLM